MKKIIQIALLLILSSLTIAQNQKLLTPRYQQESSDITIQSKAQAIEDLHVIRNSPHYYAQQIKNWQNVLKKDKKNANAWYNFYKATRYSLIDQNTGQLLDGAQSKLNDIVADMEAVSNSYEYNYILYWNGNHNSTFGPNLEKAFNANPKQVETYDDLIAYYEIIGDKLKKKVFCHKWNDSKTIPPSIMTYNKNVLLSLEKNAILITNGVNDTYPIWILQMVDGIRTDVKVVSLPLLQNRIYANRIFKEYGIKQPITTIKKFSSSAHSDGVDISKVISSNPDEAFYIGLTVNQNIIKDLKKHLFVTGLAMRYNTSPFDNISIIKANWEQKFNLEALQQVKNGHLKSNLASRQLDANYLIPALLLYRSYNENGLTAQALAVKSLVERMVSGSNKETTVSEYLANK